MWRAAVLQLSSPGRLFPVEPFLEMEYSTNDNNIAQVGSSFTCACGTLMHPSELHWRRPLKSSKIDEYCCSLVPEVAARLMEPIPTAANSAFTSFLKTHTPAFATQQVHSHDIGIDIYSTWHCLHKLGITGGNRQKTTGAYLFFFFHSNDSSWHYASSLNLFRKNILL